MTTNQPKSSKAYLKEKQRDNASCSKAKSVPESERKEEDNTDVGCGLPKTSSVDELIQVKDMTAENHTVYLDVSGPEVPILYNPWLQTAAPLPDAAILHSSVACGDPPGPRVSVIQRDRVLHPRDRHLRHERAAGERRHISLPLPPRPQEPLHDHRQQERRGDEVKGDFLSQEGDSLQTLDFKFIFSES